MNDNLNRILIKGGVTSPGEMKEIIFMLEAVGLTEVSFGSRQDLLFPISSAGTEASWISESFNTDIISDRNYQNIVSSYVAADIFDMTHWLKGSTYLYILEAFEYLPRLRINITDPRQRLVPIFSGNLNFIASESEDYWYLQIKLPHWEKPSFYPVLIYSWNIAGISKAIEAIYEDIRDVEDLFFILNKNLETNNKAIEKELQIPYGTFPYYEGMNRMGLDQYWLGLYWRNNRYDLSFLKAFCNFCLDNSIGKVCITPWKSLIIKGIRQQGKPGLEKFLGRLGINIRHSQLEMNWHLPVDDAEALELKEYVVKKFDQYDISTYGLTFGLSNDPGKRSHFTSIIIEKNKVSPIVRDFELRPTYNILYFKDFDPNTLEYESYVHGVDKSELPGLLIELSRKYFEHLGEEKGEPRPPEKAAERPAQRIHQCPSCFTIYDKMYGDPTAGIPEGTLFKNLPPGYVCPVCEAPKSGFLKRSIQYS